MTVPDDRYGYPPAYYAPGWQPERRRWDGVSIAALATGVAGLGPVPIVLGAVGLARTRRHGTRGKGLAWAGLALGLVGLVAYAAVAGLVWLLLRPLPADVAAPRYALATQVSEGNCLRTLPPDGDVLVVRVVPCADGHEARVAAVGKVADPAADRPAHDEAAAQLCRARVPDGPLVVWAPDAGGARVACLVPSTSR